MYYLIVFNREVLEKKLHLQYLHILEIIHLTKYYVVLLQYILLHNVTRAKKKSSSEF